MTGAWPYSCASLSISMNASTSRKPVRCLLCPSSTVTTHAGKTVCSNSEAAAVHRDYWHQKLSGELPVLNLPTDLSRPPIKTYNGQTLAFNLWAKRTKALQSFCRRQNVTLFMTLVAVVKVLLHRYTDQTDIIVGCPIAGRNHADLEDQIGFYINTIALRDSGAGLRRPLRPSSSRSKEPAPRPMITRSILSTGWWTS